MESDDTTHFTGLAGFQRLRLLGGLWMGQTMDGLAPPSLGTCALSPLSGFDDLPLSLLQFQIGYL